MSLKRISVNVAFGLYLLMMATPAFSQGLKGMQLFDTPETSTVGRGQRPNEGFFFSYDGLYWNISSPDTALIGDVGTRLVSYGPNDNTDRAVQISSLDTSQLSGWQTANWVGGQRIETGRITDGRGWLLSFTELQNQTTSYLTQNVTMVLADPDVDQQGHSSLQGIVQSIPNPNPLLPPITTIRNLPITFTSVNVINNTAYWSIEWMYAGRSQEIGEGGYLEWFAGPRYTELNDTFLVNANGGNLNATNWATDSQNHIVAGQLGARYFKKVGRWMLNTEGRFFGGINCQNIHQFGVIGTNLAPPGGLFAPLTLGPVAFSHADFEREFTPGIELRLEMRYQMTRNISFKAGWSGTWMDNIARSSSLIDYTLPAFGIDPTNNRQSVFINGAVIGIDINR
jgi:hypothetical protein